ncbi:NAD-dependent epimerase/dehydratase family protein [Paenibacillus mucilaginosus]|uniref:dTDP-glucose 4,6-dehydratase n=1 Tax=Paenibacillus mucilaginosus (strain KNP414) TaxID=1036673 RepID=F8FG74_PAEMK|nr:NAD-dependent epimerase/dehydratase family protein [Paenibacillus mucilaginosus]AEI43894.1 dTDP-glucose 4,6-dehydratase [Paenibacillus mucilaginosus KNP414]MCG7212599.1 GDP-mannose 4,6-dehydratase [Paenibacillus mucilaginosus]WDM25374.1 GDP-mannose 4,6-dehydratase [Paenibacillus mucilaginosus]
MYKHVLITGGTGFVGFHLAERLLQEGIDVYLLDLDDFCCRLEYGSRLMGEAEQGRLHFLPGNLLDAPLEVPPQIDAVIHLAAWPHVDFSMHYPGLVVHNNVTSTQRLLHLCGDRGLPILVTSSVEVYGGDQGRIYAETASYKPYSPYAASKVSCEVLTQTYIQCFGIRAKLIRLTNLYGPWQAPDRIIPRNMGRLIDGVPLDIQGRVVRDFVYVTDAAEAIWTVMKHGRWGEIYNISSGIGTDMQSVGRQMSRLGGETPEVELHTQEPTPSRGSSLVIDPAKIGTELGWKASVSLEEGLERTYRWYLQHAEWARAFRPQYLTERRGREFIVDEARMPAKSSAGLETA